MGLTTAMFSGLTGLSTASQMISVAGNNIANVNTTAFKRSSISFQTQILQTLANGSAPSDTLGGTNPAQVGLGAGLATIRRDFSSGSLQPTGYSTDIAIDGNGFFIVNLAGSTRYTRAGNFTLDRDFNLVNPGGAKVQGFMADDNFQITEGVLTDINIPLGVMTLAEATQNVTFSGNLNSGGDVASQGSISTSDVLYSDALATTPILATDALTTVYDADGSVLFSLGDVITLSGATKGGATLPDRTFEVGPADTTGSDDFGTTVQDLMDFMEAVLGIDTAISGGLSVVAGAITVEGNTGTANDLAIGDGDLVVNGTTAPIGWTKTQDADGESVRTTFVAYDSLGNELTVDLSMVMESKDSTGTTWRFYAQSPDDTDLDRAMATGTLNFDTDGQLVSVTDGSFTIDRADTGATTPLEVNLLFDSGGFTVTSLNDTQSQLAARLQDGSPIGTLEDFIIAEDGTINGVFSNSLIRTLGRVTLAMFTNNNGLEEEGDSLFRPTTNSGTATIVAPGTAGAGRTIGRSLELSNVELSDEFVNLISATTGFTASSRVITTADQLVQELLNIVR
ncbi:MAG: flagellar hook-basal body complex protein [Phycisphaeraceae bacterium]|nr:flagellar hook-basal body complex protein [Phycisphaeraceae bacterium]